MYRRQTIRSVRLRSSRQKTFGCREWQGIFLRYNSLSKWIFGNRLISPQWRFTPVRRTILIVFGIACFLLCPAVTYGDDMPPIVSADWLALNLGKSELIVIDIRAAAEFNKGHIPGSVNTPLGLWAVSNGGLTLELPSDERLQNLLGTFGIHPSSRIIVVSETETDFGRADATRVAWTCKVAGIEDVAVLDGGYDQWFKEARAVSTDPFRIKPGKYRGTIDRSSLISKSDVLQKIGKSTIVDARTPKDYFGLTIQPAHIKTALNLPAPWAFSDSGKFLDKHILQAMAEGIIGTDRSMEVIVYCEVGGYAATWWFLLTQMLEYRNVKLYDGSIEEWAKDPNAPVQAYSWH